MKRVVWFLVFSLVLSIGSVVSAATEVRIAGFGGGDLAIVQEMIDKFVNPSLKDEGINVVYEPIADDYPRYIVNALSAGTAPDLFYMDIFWAESVMRTGAVEPLNKYLEKSEVIKAEHIIPSLIDAFTIDGKVYGIPKDFNTLALFYNKDLFDLAGVEYPDEKDTWDTLEVKLKKVAAISDEVYGIALAPEFPRMGAFAYAAGFEPFDAAGKTNLSDPSFQDAFKWYTGLAEKKIGVMPADISQGWGGGAFAAEAVATCVEGAWIIGFLRDQAPNLNYGSTLLPLNPKTGQRGNFIFTVAWGMNADSKQKDAAFKVLEVLTSPEVQQWVLERGLALPSRAALVDNPYFKQQTKEAQANYMVFKGASSGNVKPFSFRQYGGEWMDPIGQALSAVMSGQSTVDDAIKEAQERINLVISK